eukprot:6476986-Amphidinium_carterae.1
MFCPSGPSMGILLRRCFRAGSLIPWLVPQARLLTPQARICLSIYHAASAANDDEWLWGFQQAACLYEELSGQSICTVLKKTHRELLTDGCKRATPLLTTALYKPFQRAPHLQPVQPIGDHRTLTLAFLHRTALLLEGHRCQYQARLKGITCGHPGDVHGRHAQSCCAGPIQARHDRLRDEWAKLAQMAGWTTATEQAILVAPAVRPSRPRRLQSTQTAEALGPQAADAAPPD